MKINRRAFIKLLVMMPLAASTLSSCTKPIKKSMNCSELLDYDLINYNDGEEKFTYVIYDGYGKYYELVFNDDHISEKEIYDVASDKEFDSNKDISENLITHLNITYMEPALTSLEENIGPKYEYDIADLKANLDIIKENSKAQTKVLSK